MSTQTTAHSLLLTMTPTTLTYPKSTSLPIALTLTQVPTTIPPMTLPCSLLYHLHSSTSQFPLTILSHSIMETQLYLRLNTLSENASEQENRNTSSNGKDTHPHRTPGNRKTTLLIRDSWTDFPNNTKHFFPFIIFCLSSLKSARRLILKGGVM